LLCFAGFYILRDELDTGKPDNPLQLPADKYEVALAIQGTLVFLRMCHSSLYHDCGPHLICFLLQDRMFKANGELFYPAFEGDPGYVDFITMEGATPPPGKPTVLAGKCR